MGHNIVASDQKQHWSSVREPATTKNDLCSPKNSRASKKKKL